uniref:Putative HTH-type transcriptional regulator nsrR n=1 Tax=Magnetococcus massalia (strain MO-1) TaxID=451514 RepID=A0A1S7LLA0_MAGMO|nr:putative HTH-type transcriptional regulator nsrR [Candidatus Magnetococcus massalia]
MTDYGILVMVQMAQEPQKVHSASEMAAATNLPEPSVRKVLKIMARGQLLLSVRGLKGGYQLAHPPEQISLDSLIQTLEGSSLALTDCCEENHHETCEQFDLCAMKPHWAVINHHIRTVLQKVSLQDLLVHPEQLQQTVVTLRDPSNSSPKAG